MMFESWKTINHMKRMHAQKKKTILLFKNDQDFIFLSHLEFGNKFKKKQKLKYLPFAV